MKANGGFITIWMISFLPIVLVLMALAAALGLARLEYSRKMHICRNGVLEIQQEVAKATNKLVALNPWAKQLRIQRKISDEAVAAGLETIPYLGIGVEAHRAATIAAQYILKAEQDFIRFGILAKTTRSLLRIRSEMMKLHDKSRDTKTFVIFPPPKFKMKKEPEDSLTPDYNPVENFEREQAIKIKFYFDPNYYVGRLKSLSLLNSSISKSESTLWAECSATLKKERDNKWYPVIGTGRF